MRAERERLEMTQLDFAQKVGVGKGAQINYEQNRRLPDAAYLALAAQLGADVLFILCGKGARDGLSKDELELLSLFRNASLAVKAAAIGALQSGGRVQASTTTVRVSSKGGQAAGRDINMNTDSKPAKKRS